MEWCYWTFGISKMAISYNHPLASCLRLSASWDMCLGKTMSEGSALLWMPAGLQDSPSSTQQRALSLCWAVTRHALLPCSVYEAITGFKIRGIHLRTACDYQAAVCPFQVICCHCRQFLLRNRSSNSVFISPNSGI